MYLLNNY